MADGTSFERLGAAGEPGDGSVHSIGNGLVCAYGEGPDLFQVFGPPLSTPSLFSLRVEGAGWRSVTRRASLAAWETTLRGADGPAMGAWRDFCPPGEPLLVRAWEGGSLGLRLEPSEGASVFPARQPADGASRPLLFVQAPPGRVVFHNYPCPREQWSAVTITGDGDLEMQGDNARLSLRGPGRLLLAMGSTPGECLDVLEAALARDTEPDEGEPRLAPLDSRLATIRDARVRRAAGDVAQLIVAQLGADGSSIAGHFYHLGYVRDQYGVSRAMLSLGLHDLARALLARMERAWRQCGRLSNAHGAGFPWIEHRHENDDVEITGYAIVQAFDYLRRTGDAEFVRGLFPFLAWCHEAQSRWLTNGMLPFNGDETYVAGGVFPRAQLNDGSAEATLLFIEGGEQLVAFASKHGLWSPGRCAAESATLTAARAAYAGNFIVDGRLAANNPAWRPIAEWPRHRQGVCEKSGRFGWMVRDENGRYVVPDAPAGSPGLAPRPRHFLRSVALSPLYLGSTLVPRELVAAEAEAAARRYLDTGRLPSRDDGNVTVGYDFGLLLSVLVEAGSTLAGPVAGRVLALRDATGAWVEYYDDGQPRGCRCRPWESAINLDALLAWDAAME